MIEETKDGRSIHNFCPACGSDERTHVGDGGDIIIPECIWECNGCGVSYDGPYPPYQADIIAATIVEMADDRPNELTVNMSLESLGRVDALHRELTGKHMAFEPIKLSTKKYGDLTVAFKPIVLSDEDYDRFMELLDNPRPPNEALKAAKKFTDDSGIS